MRKAVIQQVVDALPDESDVDVEAFLEKLCLLEKLDEAERQIAAGQVIPHEDIEKEFKVWLE